jgi:ribonucleoside-diphosphate reductase alpha chain
MSVNTTEGTVLGGVRQKVFLDRYSLKDSQGKPLEQRPEEMWQRVARAIAEPERHYCDILSEQAAEQAVEEWTQNFYNLLRDFKFIPGGRILTGAGSGHEVTYFNCFVIPQPLDSRGGIFDNIKLMTEIMARGGGVGVNLSSLRPRGSYIKTVNGHSSGPVSWAELYSVTTGGVIQQGGSRRGALMVMLDDDHPDIMEFISAKRIDPMTNKPVALEHANISVAVSDALMEAVKNDGEWQTQFPTKANVERAIRNGEATPEVIYYPKIRAREVWDAICTAAWLTAEPGVVFMDRYNKQSNTYYYESIRCVNPCGEQGLGDFQVCNLGALNLSAYVSNVPVGGSGPGVLPGLAEKPVFAYNLLHQDTRTAIRFLDNVIDASYYFLPENRVAQMGTRRTGLGTMGLADALIKLGVRYGSEESLEIIDSIYSTIRDAAYDVSADIAAVKGPFEMFDKDYLRGFFIKQLPAGIREKIERNGIRNAVLLTQAPTGTTSLLTGVSSGIEPVFSFAMKRVDRTGESYIYHPLMQEWKDEHPNEATPGYFVEAGELTPQEHIAVQARVQQYTDSSISKTVNGPNSDTVENVKQLYMMAYEMGCKGVTYYRDGSRDAVLTRIEDKKEETGQGPLLGDVIRERPTILRGYTRNIRAPEGTVNITINEEDGYGPFEVFMNVGRAGSDVAALAEALGRLISLTLRVPSTMTPDQRLNEVINQLSGIGGSRFVGFGPNQVRSLADAVSKALAEHSVNRIDLSQLTPDPVVGYEAPPPTQGRMTGNMCPECNQLTLVLQEGCKKCINCGHSEC